jgi:hypothetical protein
MKSLIVWLASLGLIAFAAAGILSPASPDRAGADESHNGDCGTESPSSTDGTGLQPGSSDDDDSDDEDCDDEDEDDDCGATEPSPTSTGEGFQSNSQDDSDDDCDDDDECGGEPSPSASPAG